MNACQFPLCLYWCHLINFCCSHCSVDFFSAVNFVRKALLTCVSIPFIFWVSNICWLLEFVAFIHWFQTLLNVVFVCLFVMLFAFWHVNILFNNLLIHFCSSFGRLFCQLWCFCLGARCFVVFVTLSLYIVVLFMLSSIFPD